MTGQCKDLRHTILTLFLHVLKTHSVCPLADGFDVGLMPFPWHATDDLPEVHEVAGDVRTSNEIGLLPGQHHRVPHALQHSDAKGGSRGGWDGGEDDQLAWGALSSLHMLSVFRLIHLN